jgi:hypothetical protein
MMYWIYDYPSLAIAVAFCTVFVALTWGGILFTRATIHSWIHREARANEMIGIALSSFFVLFGILLGLLAVATYQNYANVDDIVDKEASSIGASIAISPATRSQSAANCRYACANTPATRSRTAGRSSAWASCRLVEAPESMRCFKS